MRLGKLWKKKVLIWYRKLLKVNTCFSLTMKKLSVVIPTLNEEKFVGNILTDVLNNTYKDYEIIVSDSGSEDKTKEVVRRFIASYPNIRLVDAKKGAAVARNDGALHAKGEYLLFLDADQRIPNNFIESSMKEMEKRSLDMGGHYAQPIGKKFVDKLFWFVCNNLVFRTAQYISPAASTGTGLIVKKTLHKKINGFDEEIQVTHDHDYVKRGSKLGKFKMLKSVKSKFNMRRFDEEGRIKLSAKYLSLILFHLFRSKKTPFEYEFGKHRK